jgi:hypothetical protein
MKDPLIQQMREARAAVASEFDFDLHNFFAWAKSHAAAEQRAKGRLPITPALPKRPKKNCKQAGPVSKATKSQGKSPV